MTQPKLPVRFAYEDEDGPRDRAGYLEFLDADDEDVDPHEILRRINAAPALQKALKAFVDAYPNDVDTQMNDSDLYDEQPRTLQVTLGDIRAARRALWEAEGK